MQLISGSVAPNPCICAICEGGSPEFVNTLYNTEEYAPLHLAGVRLVCMGCVSNLAEAAGYVPQAVLDGAKEVIDELDRQNAILREKHLEDVDAVIAAVQVRMTENARAKKAPVAVAE